MSGPAGWLVGGAVGAIAFGIVMVLLEPDVLEAAIPAIYGLESAGPLGWAIHVAHGIVLGLVFGFLVTRPSILGVSWTDVETDALSRTGVPSRVTGAGLVYGLAVWAVLPLLVLPVWATAVGGNTEQFPTTAAGSLLGHALLGVVLGAVFAATVDLRDRPIERRLER
nr:hypothetical protein [Natrinema longum]